MKDYITVSCGALTGLTAASTELRATVSTVQAANDASEALATHLLLYGEPASTRDASDCASNTDYEHYAECDMPSIQNLVTSLLDIM